jgi:hypothetical protein
MSHNIDEFIEINCNVISNGTYERIYVIAVEQTNLPEPFPSVSICFMIFLTKISVGVRFNAMSTCRSSADDIVPLLSRSNRSNASRNSNR